MKKIYATLIALLFVTGFLFWWHWPQPAHLREVSFSQLPGWSKTDPIKSLATFKKSCKTMLRYQANASMGSQTIPMKAKDWQAVCRIAMELGAPTAVQAREFFEKNFTPFAFNRSKPIEGLFTGYYLPLLHGSLTKSEKYNVPLYGLPDNLVTIDLGAFDPELKHRRLIGRIDGKRVVPFDNRKAINKGAIDKHSSVLVWVDNRIDRFYLEIQGSGLVELPDGKRLHINYAGKNGKAYTAIGRVLIDMKALPSHAVSMQNIRAYLEKHPEKMDQVLNQNKSFVFFRISDKAGAYGAQGVPLTARYSLAVDRKYIPLGAPLWLTTNIPTQGSVKPKALQRLMIAQDTGGAIRGIVRGDFFWGAGEAATYSAGQMKNKGYYWLLLPREMSTRINDLKLK